MSTAPVGGPDGSPNYEIRLEGRLDARWAAWFDGMSLTVADDGTTSLRGPVTDQAALHGVLQKVRDLGLPLVSVAQLHVDKPSTRITPPRLPREDPRGPERTEP